MNVEDTMANTGISAYMPFINKDIFKKPDVINNFMNIESNESLKVYYVVASGSRVLASKLLDGCVDSAGRNTFNHLHQEVLKV